MKNINAATNADLRKARCGAAFKLSACNEL